MFWPSWYKGKFLLLLFVLSGSLSNTVEAQIVNIEDKRQGFDTLGTFGQLNASVNWTRNTGDILSMSGLARVDILQPNGRWLVLGQYSLIRSSGNNIINDRFGHLRYGRKLRAWLTWEGFGQLQVNEPLEIDLRALLGTGPRFRLVEQKRLEAYLGLLYMYEYDELGPESLRYRDHRLSTYFSFKAVVNEQLSLASSTYYQPLLFSFDFPRISTITTLEIGIAGGFAVTSRFTLLHDARQNRDFPDVPATVHTWTNGLRFSF